MTLQEVKQLEPPNARWCLKHIRMKPMEENGMTVLRGNWEAQGCTPGSIVLRWQPTVGSQPTANNQQPIADTYISSTISGRYIGTLSQSDRDYGFYFEIRLEEDGSGQSSITSDGEGGNATHELKWSYDPTKSEVYFTEKKVLEKSVADWPWCIKKANLFFQEDKNKLSLGRPFY